MKKLKTIDETSSPEDEVAYYSFFPLFDDELELSDDRKQTVIRLVKWLLDTVNITPDEFYDQAQRDIPNKR